MGGSFIYQLGFQPIFQTGYGSNLLFGLLYLFLHAHLLHVAPLKSDAKSTRRNPASLIFSKCAKQQKVEFFYSLHRQDYYDLNVSVVYETLIVIFNLLLCSLYSVPWQT